MPESQNSKENTKERKIRKYVSFVQKLNLRNTARNKRKTRKRKKKHFGKRNLLIINTGHWSLKYRTLLDHLIDMHKVAEAVKRLGNSKLGKNFKNHMVHARSVQFLRCSI